MFKWRCVIASRRGVPAAPRTKREGTPHVARTNRLTASRSVYNAGRVSGLSLEGTQSLRGVTFLPSPNPDAVITTSASPWVSVLRSASFEVCLHGHEQAGLFVSVRILALRWGKYESGRD